MKLDVNWGKIEDANVKYISDQGVVTHFIPHIKRKIIWGIRTHIFPCKKAYATPQKKLFASLPPPPPPHPSITLCYILLRLIYYALFHGIVTTTLLNLKYSRYPHVGWYNR